VDVRTETVEIRTGDGTMPAHQALPEEPGPHPAVIVIMEAFGLVPHIRGVTERIAAEGYVAIAPDYYYRQLPDNQVGYDELPKAIALMQKVNDERFLDDQRAVLGFLHGRSEVGDSKIGVTGFCMGGRLAFLSACSLPGELSAAAPFYGGGIAGHLGQAENIRCPLYLFFGDRDAFIPVEQVREIDAKLGSLGVSYTLKLYEGADHGFFCEARESHSPIASADAWDRLKSFLAENLL
jgi:carboxymethylenebutenolidase